MRYLITIFILLCSASSFSQEKAPFVKLQPVPHKAVNDFNKFLTASERKALEKDIAAYRAASGNSIVFISLDSLTDPKTQKQYTIEEAALLYFNTWGIGDSIKNNGVLLMVSRNPRRVRIEVGRGVNDILTNSICQTIVDDKLVPNFKKDSFFLGIKEAVDDIKYHLDNPPTQAAEEPAPASVTDYDGNDNSQENGSTAVAGIGVVVFLIIIGVVLLLFSLRILSMFRRMVSVVGNRISPFAFFRSNNNFNSADDSPGHNSGNNDWSPNDNAAASFSSFDSSPSSSPSIDSSPSGGGSSDGGGASGSW